MAVSGNSAKPLTARTLTVNGTSTWDGTGVISMSHNANLNIGPAGSANIISDIDFGYCCGTMPNFNVDGSWTKSAGSGATAVGVNFTNNGTTSITSGGTLEFYGSGNPSSGTFHVGNPSSIAFRASTYDLATTSVMSGPGTFIVSGAIVNFSGSYNATGNAVITAGAFNVNATNTASNVSISGGTLGGSAQLNVSNSLTWTGGSMEG